MRRRDWIADIALAVGFAALDTVATLAGASWWPTQPNTIAWVLLGAQVLTCLSLAFRQVASLPVLLVHAGFTLVVTALVWPLGALVPANPDTIYAPFAASLAAYGPLYFCRDSRRRAFVALIAFTVVVARPWEPSILLITIALLRIAVGPLLALYFDARRRLVRALTERAERAEREQHLLAEQARAEERARLAGEMHDVVTHRVSLMVLQAGAMRMTAQDEETRRQAEELRVAGVQALDELRDLVGILRAEPEGDESPSVSGFADLVAESTAVGVPAELVEEGDPGLASPLVGRTAYRVVREALTNVRKHAPGARVTVRVAYDKSQVRLAVTNTAPTARPDALAATGSGLGIANLRQRIEVVQGSLSAGSTRDGGFTLEATLPAYVPTAV
ncbi:sensor histidine kinase [Nonomuraea helvata]|uniref:histidine kinase n=1 Tax=Nonomuraea helvata TaxID=37484 RepID=A0ABV5S8S9_9ACTN